MNGPHAIPEESTCLRCHESIGADESYSGYCLGCLLLAALPLDQVAETESNRQFGPYELLVHPDGSFVELGRGSMGITYEALDTNLYSSVALKVIHSETAAREKNRERFLREARAAARLRHPHVANVLYYGVREDGQCFYAMELVEGETLAQRPAPWSTTDKGRAGGDVSSSQCVGGHREIGRSSSRFEAGQPHVGQWPRNQRQSHRFWSR